MVLFVLFGKSGINPNTISGYMAGNGDFLLAARDKKGVAGNTGKKIKGGQYIISNKNTRLERAVAEGAARGTDCNRRIPNKKMIRSNKKIRLTKKIRQNKKTRRSNKKTQSNKKIRRSNNKTQPNKKMRRSTNTKRV